MRQPALPLSVEKSSGDSDLWEGIEDVAMAHLASGLFLGGQSGGWGGAEESRQSGWSCDHPCVFGGCGKDVKGGLLQPLNVVSSGTRPPWQPTLNASFNTWWHYAQSVLTSSDLLSPLLVAYPEGKKRLACLSESLRPSQLQGNWGQMQSRG